MELAYKNAIGGKKFGYAETVTPNNTKNLVVDSEADSLFFRELEKKGILLDQEQLEAVRSINGPVIVVAGAGSGKTRVLTSRACYILRFDKTVKASQIMLITFTVKAAAEMTERLNMMLDAEIVNKMVIGTFHSIFLRLLRSQGYKEKVIGNDEYRRAIVSRFLKQLKVEAIISPEEALSKISSWKCQMLCPEDITPQNAAENHLQKCFSLYEEWLYENKAMDFDDILNKAVRFLEGNEEYRAYLQEHFKYICVDEYQDSNFVQNRLIELITKPSSNVFFVGDPKQNIYGFRLSSSRFMKELVKVYPTIKHLYLTTNYRSNRAIVGAANEIILELDKVSKVINSSTEGLQFIRPQNSHEEAAWIAEYIEELAKKGVAYRDMAVLYRINEYSRAIVEECIMRKIPCKVYNSSNFYEKRIVKQVLAHLRVAINDEDLSSIADIAPTLYIPRDNAFEYGTKYLGDMKGIMVLEGLCKQDYQKKKLQRRHELIESLTCYKPKTAIQQIRKNGFNQYVASVAENSIYQDMVDATLDELEASASRFPSLENFIAFVDQMIWETQNMTESDDAVTCMSIHQSKGLEFERVFLIGVIDRVLPHVSALDKGQRPDQLLTKEEAFLEENRILYVGMTRAKNELIVSSPKVYHGRLANVSTFLKKEQE